MSCPRSALLHAANETHRQLHRLTCKLANSLRPLAARPALANWSPTTLRDRLVKAGARVTRRARIGFPVAAVALSREKSAALRGAIARLLPAAPPRI
jgi:hypothetical protein